MVSDDDVQQLPEADRREVDRRRNPELHEAEIIYTGLYSESDNPSYQR